jgi:hypothetical protein
MNIHLTSPAIAHPRKEIVPLAVGLAWGNDGAIYQEKLDGEFSLWTESAKGGNNILTVEKMADGRIIVWDCLASDGQDLRGAGTMDRFMAMVGLCERFKLPMVETVQDGGALLQRVLARGGEGIVRKLPHATYYDAMTACKRLQTWQCAVTAINYATGGAAIVDAITGENRGTCPLRNRVGQFRVGSIVKVEGLGLHAGGKIRDPRPCKDTETSWLVRF